MVPERSGSDGCGETLSGSLLILGIVALVGKVLLQNLSTARRNRAGQPSAGAWDGERYAEAATTNTVVGLASALQEATMALRRYRDYWRHGVVRVQRVGAIDEAERAFNQAVSRGRVKRSEELTTNIDGVRRQTPRRDSPNADEVGQYLVVTLIVATGYPELTGYRTPSLDEMEDALQPLGTLLAADLLGLEVIWSPENPDDALTEDELLAEYPELSGL